jgi:hypothetical protein
MAAWLLAMAVLGATWAWLWPLDLAINGYGLVPLGYGGFGLAPLGLAPLGLLMAMAWCRLAMAALAWRRLAPLGYWLSLAWHRLGLAVNGYGLAIAVWLWPLAKNIKREPLSRERDKVVLRITGSMQSLEPPLSPPSLKCIILLLVERGRDSNNRVPFTYCTFSSLASIKYYSL